MAHSGSTGRRHETVDLSHLAFEALTGDSDSTEQVPAKMVSALRCYLGDRGNDRPAWPYPGFLRGSETQGEVRIEFDVEADLWRDFSAEAAAQGISVEQLAEHAAFYFAAELSAGRLTRRILEDLEPSRGEKRG